MFELFGVFGVVVIFLFSVFVAFATGNVLIGLAFFILASSVWGNGIDFLIANPSLLADKFGISFQPFTLAEIGFSIVLWFFMCAFDGSLSQFGKVIFIIFTFKLIQAIAM